MFHSKYAENRLFFVATCEISRVVIECRSFDRELADPSSATRSRITARAWVLGRQETATPGVFCQTTTTREHHDAPLRPVWIVARNQCRRRAMLLAMIKAVKPFIATDANPDTRRSDDRSVWPHPELHYGFHPQPPWSPSAVPTLDAGRDTPSPDCTTRGATRPPNPTQSLTLAPAPFCRPGSSPAPCQPPEPTPPPSGPAAANLPPFEPAAATPS